MGSKTRQTQASMSSIPPRLRRAAIVICVVFLMLAASITCDRHCLLSTESSGEFVGDVVTVDINGGGDYTSIQAAVDAASDGDTIYVYNGTYEENIVVDKRVKIEGESRASTTITGSGTGNVVLISHDGVVFSDFSVTNSNPSHEMNAIYLSSCTDCSVERCSIYANDVGVLADSSSSNVIAYNSMHSNNIGVYLYQSNYVKVFANTVNSSNNYGIQVTISQYNSIDQNLLTQNGIGVYLVSTQYCSVYKNTIRDNYRGLRLENSFKNTIHLNSFKNNNFSAYDNKINVFDSDNAGNYWDDYEGQDADGDGKGDTSYSIPGGSSVDRYPLVEPPVSDDVPPTIEHVQAYPNPGEKGGFVNISCDAFDNTKIEYIQVNVSSPDDSTVNVTMNRCPGTHTYFYRQRYDAYGTYTYSIWAEDAFNNTNTTTAYTFSISLSPEPPSISSIQALPSPQEVSEPVNLSCMASDNVAVDTVKVAVTDPDGNPVANVSMTGTNLDAGNNGSYYHHFVPHELGTYSFRIWASDVSGFTTLSGAYEFVSRDSTPPHIDNVSVDPVIQDVDVPVTISANVTDNHDVGQVCALIACPNGTTVNHTMTASGGLFSLDIPLSQIGSYTVSIWATDESNNGNTSTSISFTVTDFPTVNFTYTPSSPTDWDVVYFTSTSTDSDGSIVNHSWTIRKENKPETVIFSSYQRNVSHNFSDNGNYLVTLAVTDDTGAVNTTTKTVTVDNIPPVADFSYMPRNATVGDIISFTDNSTDRDGSVKEWKWQFGDGTSVTGSQANTTHAYQKDGVFNVTLTVTDNDYDSDTATGSVTVTDIEPPRVENVSAYPNPQEVRGEVNVTCHVTDDVAVDAVQINVTGIDPYNDHITKTASMHSSDNGTTWWYEAPYNTTGEGYHDTGNYSATIRAVDPSGNSNTSSPYVFTIFQPAKPPEISTVWDTPPVKQYGCPVNISCNASDNVALVAVGVNVTYPDGSSINVSMNPFQVDEDHNGIYFYNQTYPSLGNYSYTIWAMDINNYLTVSTNHSFSIVDTMPPQLDNLSITPSVQQPNETVNVSCMVSDNLEVANVSIRVTRDNQTIASKKMNRSSLYYLTRNYSQRGRYNVTIHAYDTMGNNDTFHDTFSITTFPTANFSYSPASPTSKETVTFTDQSSDPDGSIAAWHWSFGDGNTSTVQHPSHSYATDGVYQVTLTVTDDDGADASTTKTIEIQNVPPTAHFTYTPAQPTDLDTVTFNASGSNDSDGAIANYTWTLGDGNRSYGATSTHHYRDNGTYQVTLTVTDDDGATDSCSRNVTIDNVPPVAALRYRVYESNLYIAVEDNGSYDPDGDTITNYTWTFGDDTTAYGPSATHTYSQPGSYVVTLQVTDIDGDTNATSTTVSVGVYLSADFSYSDDLASDTSVAFSDNSSHAATWHWQFGDGATSTETNPSHVYPIGNYYNVTLTVTNGSANATVSKTVPVDTTIHFVKNADNVVNYLPWLGDPIAASSLAGEIGSDVMPEGSVVSRWNTTRGAFDSYVVGVSPSSYDFTITPYDAVVLRVKASGTFTEQAYRLADHLVQFSKNSDNVANHMVWSNVVSIQASSLAGEIGSDVMPEGSVVSRWNTTRGAFDSYVVGVSPPSYDFTIHPGDCVVLRVAQSGQYQIEVNQ